MKPLKLALGALQLAASAAIIWLLGPLIGVGASQPLASAHVRLLLIVALVAVVIWRTLVPLLGPTKADDASVAPRTGVASGQRWLVLPGLVTNPRFVDAVFALVTALLLLAWAVTYYVNRDLVREVAQATYAADSAIAGVSSRSLDVLAVLPALDATLSIVEMTSRRSREALSWGFDQRRKLNSQAKSAYRRVLTGVLLPRLVLMLERQLEQSDESLEFRYEALQTYLMLASPERYDADRVIAWMTIDLEKTLGSDADSLTSLLAHVDALFRVLPHPLPFPLDSSQIQATQAELAQIPIAERLHSRLKLRAAGARLPAFKVVEAAGPQAARVFVRASGAPLTQGVPGLYTRAGYREVVVVDGTSAAAELIDESWILGEYAPSTIGPEVVEEAEAIYFRAYIDQYDQLLSDLRVAPLSSPSLAARILGDLAQPSLSPLVALLAAVAQETQLRQYAEQTRSVSDAVSRLRGLLGNGAGTSATAKLGAASVDEHFAWVRAYADPKEPSSMQRILVLLASASELMDKLAKTKNLAQAQLDQGHAVVRSMRREAAVQPVFLHHLLDDVASGVQALLSEASGKPRAKAH
ncbi:MAG: ImcF-related family protein [Pseudomonadota bacterium]